MHRAYDRQVSVECPSIIRTEFARFSSPERRRAGPENRDLESYLGAQMVFSRFFHVLDWVFGDTNASGVICEEQTETATGFEYFLAAGFYHLMFRIPAYARRRRRSAYDFNAQQ